MIQRYKDLHDAVRQASMFTYQWVDDNGCQYDPAQLTRMLEIGETESGIDIMSDQMAYYIVDDLGALGLTYDGERTVYWIVRPAVMPAYMPPQAQTPSMPQPNPSLVGYSQKYNMVEFQEALHKNKSSNNGCAAVFIIAPVVIVPIYTYFSDDAAFTGLLIGAAASLVLFVIYMITKVKTKLERPWEGQVVNKYVKEERVYDKLHTDPGYDPDHYRMVYHQYVIVQGSDGKQHKICQDAGYNSHVYDYFKVGDRLRFLAGTDLLFPYEKYDKSRDQYLICQFCNRRVDDLFTDYCPHCHKPLLK